MTKRKRPKRARRERTRSSLPPGPPAPVDYSSEALLGRAKRWIAARPGGSIFLLLCGISGLSITYWGVVNVGRSIYNDTIPRIHVFGSNPNDPFALPFTVTNASDWFDMKDVVWSCGIIEVRSADGRSRIQDLELIPADRSLRTANSGSKPAIGSKQTDGFRCGVAGAGAARLIAKVRYKTLWFERTPVEMEFTWISDRWFEGKLH